MKRSVSPSLLAEKTIRKHQKRSVLAQRPTEQAGAGPHHQMDQNHWLEATGGCEGKLVPHSPEERKRKADGGRTGLPQQETQAPNLPLSQNLYPILHIST